MIDIGIITVIPTEIDALFNIFGINKEKDYRVSNNVDYWVGNIYSAINDRYISVAISFLYGTSGNIDSAILTSLFVNQLKPRMMCLVGIAAGDEDKVNIGDVIIPHTIHDVTTFVRKKDQILPRQKTLSIDARIQRQLKITPVDKDILKRKVEAFNPNTKLLKEIAQTIGLKKTNISDFPIILDGSIVSGNTLLRDSSYFPEFQSASDESCRAGEMEAAGFSRACELLETPWLVVRGISDYGDERKSDDFQYYAAINASIVLRQLLERNFPLEIFPQSRAEDFELSFTNSLEQTLSEAYNKENWNYVVEIGSFLSRPLWISGKYKLRKRIGELVEDSAACTDRNKERSIALIDDIGWTSYVLGDEKTAIKSISDGLRIAKEISNNYLCAKANRHLASINRQKKLYDICHAHLTEAESYAEKILPELLKNEMEVSLIVSKAKLLIEQRDTLKAIDFLEGARQTYLNMNDSIRAVKVFNIIGLAYQKHGNDHKATEVYLDGYELALDIGRIDEAFSNAMSLANIYQTNKDDESAIKWATITMKIYSETPHRKIDNNIVNILKDSE